MQVPMATTTTTSVLLLVVCFLAAATAGGAVQFRVVNSIQDEESRRNFDAEIGSEFAGRVLVDATHMAWTTLGQAAASDRKDVPYVTLSVEGYRTVAQYCTTFVVCMKKRQILLCFAMCFHVPVAFLDLVFSLY
ncbi:hypothetical protein EJB05_13348, partial [Eragrostis curvula]